MGVKGIHISVGVTTLATILMLVSLICEWQILAFYGIIIGKVHLTSIYFNGDGNRYVINGKVRFRELNGNLSTVRDVVCGIPYGYCNTLCDAFTTDLVCGIIIILLYIAAILLNCVACFYLLYYSWTDTKREYRKVALRCLCVTPILIFIALFCYTGAIFRSTALHTTTVTVVVTPGSGFFVAMVAFIVMSIVPCISQRWALPTKEILDGERRQIRREAKDAFLTGKQSYGTMFNQPVDGYPPADGYHEQYQSAYGYPPRGQHYQDHYSPDVYAEQYAEHTTPAAFHDYRRQP